MLDATVSGTSSNSYLTLLEATTIFSERLGVGADWSDLSTADKEAALITATRRLDQEEYQGYKTVSTQALKFPRYSIEDEDGVFYDSQALPLPLKLATAELALQLARNPELFDDTGLEPFSTLSKGDFSVSNRNQSAGKLSAQVARFLRDFAIGGDGVALLRG